MSEFMSYDPWSSITTRNGLPGDEMISMLQKSIRRGVERDALMAAYEMYITSPQFEDKLWRRLTAISVEDIGFGEPMAPVLIRTLDEMRREFPYNDGDRPMFFVHAIRYLCRCKKERSSDHVKNMLINDFNHGKKPEPPEYCLDLHTVRGREMGRDVLHFLTEASKVSPQHEVPEFQELHRQYIEMVKSGQTEDVAPEDRPFEYAAFQY